MHRRASISSVGMESGHNAIAERDSHIRVRIVEVQEILRFHPMAWLAETLDDCFGRFSNRNAS